MAQKNSMDDIIIEYGIKQEKRYAYQKDLLRRRHPEAIKEMSLSKFLEIRADDLSSDEQEVQAALQKIYDLNGNNSAIYFRFPKRNMPLRINITDIIENNKSSLDETLGRFLPQKNEIRIKRIREFGLPDLVGTLAHELKHAQQYTDEKGLNHYQRHQLSFLKEAQARACEDGVIASLWPDHPKAKAYRNGNLLSKIFGEAQTNVSNEEIRTIHYLETFLAKSKHNNTFTSYKDKYDDAWPVLKTDTPLTEIPSEYNITDTEGILTILKDVPREAREPVNKAKQAVANDDEKNLLDMLTGEDLTPGIKYVRSMLGEEGKPFLIDDKYLSTVVRMAYKRSEDTNSTNLVEAILKSHRCSQEIIDLQIFKPLLSLNRPLTDELLNTRIELLKKLLAYTPRKGKNGNLKERISITKVEKAIRCEKKKINECYDMSKDQSDSDILEKCDQPTALDDVFYESGYLSYSDFLSNSEKLVNHIEEFINRKKGVNSVKNCTVKSRHLPKKMRHLMCKNRSRQR